MTAAVRSAVSEVVAAGERPFVLGGCCSLVPGAMAGARDVRDPERAAHVTRARHRTGHERTATAQDEWALARRHDLAHRGADRDGHGQHVGDPDHACVGVAPLIADVHVQVPGVAGIEGLDHTDVA